MDLDRKLSGDEWERFDVDLRETFDEREARRSEGSIRQWANGNLQALRDNRLCVGARERPFPAQHLVEGTPETVETALSIGCCLTTRLLRTHIRRRADGQPGMA